MLNRIISFSIKNKLIIGLCTLALSGYGIYQATLLPIDAVPDITDNQVQVITMAPSFGATDIERLVTFPVEQANSNISGIKEIRSFSRFGLSLVTIVFNDATNIYWARQQVAERLQKVQTEIPPGIGTPEMGPITTGLGEIYQYVLRPLPGYEKKYDATELRTIQDWIVRRQLLGVKGVAEVSSFGGRLKQYSIEADPAKLQAHGISITDLFHALETNNQNTGGAYIEKGPTLLYIRSEGLLGSRSEIEQIVIKTTETGMPLLVRDVAEIKTGHAVRYGALCYNDEGEVAGAVVMMLKGANSSEVIRNVKERVAQIQKNLPEGVIIEPFLDRTKMVNNAINTVETNLLEGALIVVFVLVLFLGNLRAGLLVASVIPLSMLFAIIMMNLFGVSGNLMSLGALDFGLIVDGAVIIVEAVMHRLGHSRHFAHINRLSPAEMDAEVEQSAGKMMNSAVFGQMIILIVYLPIFTLQGIEGKMFKPMAQTVAFALAGAFLLSLTYIPMMSAWVLSRKIKHRPNWSDRIMAVLERGYQKTLSRVLAFPKTVILTAIGLFFTALFVLRSLGGEFIPALEEGDFAVDTRVLTGSNLNTTIEATQKAAHILKTRFPEVEKVVTKIGSGEVPTDPMPMEASDMMVILKPKKEWTSASSFDELSAKMGAALQEVPGITAGFQFPVQMRFNELMTGARQDVVCKIFGEDLDSLSKYAAQLGAVVNTVEGAKNLYVETVSGLPQVVIRFNRNAIAQYGLNIADINRVVSTAFAGQSAGMLFEGEKRFDVVVRLKGELKKSLKDVQQLLVPAPGGIQLPLYMLADVQVKDGPNQIQREDAKRRIVVGFNVRGRDVQSVVKELQQKAGKQLKLPPGYYVTYGGSFENLNEARKRLLIAVPVSLLLILVLLYFAFRSLKQGLLIYSAIPLSAIGGIFFLALRGMPFSISAGVGFIALFGVAVLNGIVLIAEFNRQKAEGLTDFKRIVLMGTKIRLRPVLMTAFVASLGFLPMALSNGAGAEVQRPLATVVIGGLLIATLLTLFVLPVLYIMFEKGFTKKSKNKKNMKSVLLLALMFGAATATFAQQPVSLKTAQDSAVHNHPQIRYEQEQAQYRQLLTGTAKTIPAASIVAEAGQLNSVYTDTRLTFSQSFSLPKVYRSQKILLEEEWKTSMLNITVSETRTRFEVARIYHAIQINRAKKLVNAEADSLYTAFYRKALKRLAAGESNRIETIGAETQLEQLRLEQEMLRYDSARLLFQFNYLLNTAAVYTPGAEPVYSHRNLLADSAALNNHPEIQVAQQQQREALAMVAVEKSKLLPGLQFGFSNGSIQGVGANNKTYTAAQRFTSMQAGIGIPLFTRAQKEKVNSARQQVKAAGTFYEAAIHNIQGEYLAAWQQYTKERETVRSYETKMLPQAEQLTATASRQLAGGSINYLEWVQLVNQVITIKMNYTDALNRLGEAINQLSYFNIK